MDLFQRQFKTASAFCSWINISNRCQRRVRFLFKSVFDIDVCVWMTSRIPQLDCLMLEVNYLHVFGLGRRRIDHWKKTKRLTRISPWTWRTRMLIFSLTLIELWFSGPKLKWSPKQVSVKSRNSWKKSIKKWLKETKNLRKRKRLVCVICVSGC